MPSKPIELPPEVAKAFIVDMRAFHAEKSPIMSITYFDDEPQRDFKSTLGRSAAACVRSWSTLWKE
jgi:hypothetical protein